MKKILILFLLSIVFVYGCVQVTKPLYKRITIPNEFDTATQEIILKDAILRLKGSDIKEKIQDNFPSITEADLHKTDIRWEVRITDTTKSYILIVGIKDTSQFPDAEKFSQYFYDLAKQAVEEAIANQKALKQGKPRI